MNIGIRLKTLREEAKLTQEEVGKAIGVTKATVNRYETEEIDIKRTIAIKLAHVLHTTPSYIMGWTDDKNQNLNLESQPPILSLGGVSMASIQERLKEQRLKRGYTLAQLADLLDVKEATVQRYESGEIKNIKHETITRLADILNCSPCYLMGWTDNELRESQQTVSHVIKKFDKLNRIDQLKTEAYIDGLLANHSYTQNIESNLDRTVFGHETYPRAVAAPDVTTHIDNRKKKRNHT